jgi:CBS domain-containing protein
MQNISSLMVTRVVAVQPETTLEEAATHMRRSNVGALPVVRNGRVIGMITDRDIVIRGLAEHKSPEHAHVSEIMTTDIVACHEDDEIRDAARLMEERRVGRVVVLDREGHLKGILSLGNITQHLGQERLAGLVGENLGGGRLRGVLGLGVILSAGVLGAIWLNNRPELRNRLVSRIRERAEEWRAA